MWHFLHTKERPVFPMVLWGPEVTVRIIISAEHEKANIINQLNEKKKTQPQLLKVESSLNDIFFCLT